MNLTGAETAQNIAEIYVFEELVPDEWLNESASDSVDKRPSLKQRMQNFATKRLQFITDKGVTLPAKLELVEPREQVDRASPFCRVPGNVHFI